MSKTLLMLGHPDYKSSLANRTIVEEFHRISPEAEIVNLNALYPDGKMDAHLEQKRLSGCRTLIFEFPLWWYSSPSLMHAYVEQVFTYGFAYGSQGKALEGMRLILSFTTGGPEQAYKSDGRKGITLEQMLPPFKAMAELCRMDLQEPLVSYAMKLLNPADEKLREEIIAKAKTHAALLAKLAAA